MATHFDVHNLPGSAHWMRTQAREEVEHAMKIYRHLDERQSRIVLKAIGGPPTEWNSSLAAFQAAYEHEVRVTARINNLVDIARDEKDKAAEVFLQWFVNEQVEEEASTDSVVQKLKMIGESANGLYMLDRELAHRGAE